MKFKELTSNVTKNLLKMKSGEEVRGVFRGDPVDFRQHWIANRSYLCSGNSTCEYCKAGEKSSFRFRINIVINENGAHVAKVFEQGKSVYEALKSLNTDYALEKNQVKIKRMGSGTETLYTILPVPNGELKDGALKAIEAIPLVDLSLDASRPAEPIAEEEDSEDVPF